MRHIIPAIIASSCMGLRRRPALISHAVYTVVAALNFVSYLEISS